MQLYLCIIKSLKTHLQMYIVLLVLFVLVFFKFNISHVHKMLLIQKFGRW